MIKLPPDVQIEAIPLEVRYRGVLRGLLTRIKCLYEAIYDRYGEEGLELIRQAGGSYGSRTASRVRHDGAPWDIQKVK